MSDSSITGSCSSFSCRPQSSYLKKPKHLQTHWQAPFLHVGYSEESAAFPFRFFAIHPIEASLLCNTSELEAYSSLQLQQQLLQFLICLLIANGGLPLLQMPA